MDKDFFQHIGIYPIIDEEFCRKLFLNPVRVASQLLAAGIKILQYRNKISSDEEFEEIAKEILLLSKEREVPLVINDRLFIAKKIGAAGVHLGQEDISALSDSFFDSVKGFSVVGISTHSFSQALSAQLFKPTYISFGAIFATATKPQAVPLGVEALTEVCLNVRVPVVAIGGIREDNLKKVWTAGVSGVAMISEILSAYDVKEKVRELMREGSEKSNALS